MGIWYTMTQVVLVSDATLHEINFFKVIDVVKTSADFNSWPFQDGGWDHTVNYFHLEYFIQLDSVKHLFKQFQDK